MANKKRAGRPTKLTERFIHATEQVLFGKTKDPTCTNAIIFTDEELIFQINELLQPEERIDERTFQRWKAKSKEKDAPKDERQENFVVLYKKALVQQKNYLFEQLKTAGDKSWYRYAWIIERKFDDWNIKQKIDHTTKGRPLTVNLVSYKEKPKG